MTFANCDLLVGNPALAANPYRVWSPVAIFQQFLEAIEDKTIDVTNQNVSCFFQFCEEFDF
jgi:hypothetical protein